MKLKFIALGISIFTFFTAAQAKIWRVNNNAGVQADFTSFTDVINSASVAAGDTIHMEASSTDYSVTTMTKRLVVIGLGYFLNPADATYPANPGLQASAFSSGLSGFTIANGANGSKFLGIRLSSISINGTAAPISLTFEKCFFSSGIFFASAAHSGITIRKCFFSNSRIEATGGSLTNFVCENNIFYTTFSFINLPVLTGANNIFRNNSLSGVGVGCTIANCYVANNISDAPGWTFTNCSIKNNLFSNAQTLPGTATNNLISVSIPSVYVGGSTGSLDSRMALKAGSPALAAGLTLGPVITPDCGAYGATDPYKLSGIPNIPSIYTLTVPISIPSGSSTMSVTFSTRNNN
ncbi:MAG: hypothetical protein JWQ27_1893 [Ferruginibacter sp.]|nr:hypothetical protein [Ferruginibacter sp.]